MPRPCRRRRVRGSPGAFFYKPGGRRLRDLSEVALEPDEFEAVRLKDHLGLEQTECAGRMEVSQPTFHRILSSARSKIADALVNGKAIRISGSRLPT